MNKELMESMNILEKEYNISKDTLLEAIENSLLTACKNHFGKADNVKVIIDPDGCDYSVYMEKEVVETVEDPITQISLADARMIAPRHVLGDIVQIPIDSHDFGRIATQNAKNVILQKIREESRKSQLSEWQCKEKEVVTGIVQRYIGRNVSVDLGKIDAILPEAEQVKGEVFQRTESGNNGADCTFTADSQEMSGNILWDSISNLDLKLTNGTILTGSILQDETNAGDGGNGTCNVTIDALSAWTVTGNSTVTSLTCNGSITGDDGKSVTIAGTDGTVFVQGTGKYTITTGSYNE